MFHLNGLAGGQDVRWDTNQPLSLVIGPLAQDMVIRWFGLHTFIELLRADYLLGEIQAPRGDR